MTIRCIIVEDEKLAQDVLKKYISLIPTLELVQSCSSATEAFSCLHSNKVDLIFLDINMPELSGIEFLKTLQNPPKIIITTAYSEFAIEGYEYSVCDYLLKPIRYERFLKAIDKLIGLNNRSSDTSIDTESIQPVDYIFIKEDNVIQKIYFIDLLYIQAFGNYLKIFTKDSKTLVTRTTIRETESQLPSSLFLRVHKSYVVAINSIDKIKYNDIYIRNETIPIGATYKQEVLNKLRRPKLDKKN